MAAQGISVFVYDKRGTGGSEGEYTQNFELLAADAAKALDTARGMTAGRHGRAGFFGGSQGGWVAPLAATRTKADFVAVGFGLVASPIEEDREPKIGRAHVQTPVNNEHLVCRLLLEKKKKIKMKTKLTLLKSIKNMKSRV